MTARHDHWIAGEAGPPASGRYLPTLDPAATELAATDGRRVATVVDTSTIGVDAARAIDAELGTAGIAYVDAPVSGGVAGARARTLFVMVAGTDAACDAARPVLAGLGDRRRRVGGRPGVAQALKLASNFLPATALAATSEAVAFGQSVGLDMAAKDLRLYLAEVEAAGGPSAIGVLTTSIWRRSARDEPGADFTRIYPFVTGT